MLSGVTDGARGRRWRRSRTTPPPAEAPAADPAPPGPPSREVDDLPGFFDAPPGSPRALPAAPTGPAPGPATPEGRTDDPPTAAAAPTDAPRRPGGRRGLLVGGAVVAVVAALAATALLAGRDHDDRATPAGAAAGTTTAGRASASDPTTSPATTAAPLTAAAPGDLAPVDLDPGADGFTATVSFGGVVLEPRAVGVTVAYPELRVSSDGDRTLAHVEFAVWNCLADTPPADPTTADCRRGLTEYADLPSPDLQAARTDDGVRLTGSFPTYTRPNGSPPVATGRSYALAVQVQDRGGSVSGTLQLGDGSAAAVPGGTFAAG